MNLDDVGQRALKGKGASIEEARFLAHACLPDIMSWTDKIRERFFNRSIWFCAIINARSGACSENCRFCAQSAHYATDAATYPLLDSDKIVQAAKEASDFGASSFSIVTSGPTAETRELESIASAVSAISSKTGCEACASLGKLQENQLRVLKARRLNRYHHNLETSRAFFPSICSTHTWDERLGTVRAAKAAGLRVCSGGLFGMGETWEDRISLGIALQELEVDSVPMNFLHPVPGTPLEHISRLSPEEGLRIIALFRFILPQTTIRVCGGRLTTLGDRQEDMFRAGSNALMTGNYLTTAGADPVDDRAMLKKLGLTLADGAPRSCVGARLPGLDWEEMGKNEQG